MAKGLEGCIFHGAYGCFVGNSLGTSKSSAKVNALEALCSFNFSGPVLREMTKFAVNNVATLLRTESSPSTRILAARACVWLASLYKDNPSIAGSDSIVYLASKAPKCIGQLMGLATSVGEFYLRGYQVPLIVIFLSFIVAEKDHECVDRMVDSLVKTGIADIDDEVRSWRLLLVST